MLKSNTKHQRWHQGPFECGRWPSTPTLRLKKSVLAQTSRKIRMIPPNKKGRPPSKATIEKRRIEDMVRNLPPHLKSLSKAELAILKKSFEQSDAIKKEILADYKHGKTTPDSHAYSMASLGDESMIGYEKKSSVTMPFTHKEPINIVRKALLPQRKKTQIERRL